MSAMDHTSGGQRAAEVEATTEQLAERDGRLLRRAQDLAHELGQLALAAGAHRTPVGDRVARAAHLAQDELGEADLAAEDGRNARLPPPDATAFLAMLRRDGFDPERILGDSTEGVTHTRDREPQRGQSSTQGAVLMGITETRSLITPDSGDEPPFAAELAVDRPPHDNQDLRRP